MADFEVVTLDPHKPNKPMMKCGHAATGTNSSGKAFCIICAGLGVGGEEVDDNPPSLAGRVARCDYYGRTARDRCNYGGKRGEPCTCEQPSSPNLPFFGHQPDEQFDMFYCGCFGWD